MTGLYIHVPYCRAKCAYCDFASFPSGAGVPAEYLEALSMDMRRHRGVVLDTVYIGGGTPSLLSSAQIGILGSRIRASFNSSSVVEMTCEVNPESVTPEKIAALRSIGVNRVSMGLQSTDDDALRRLGRIHSVRDFETAYRVLRDAGCANVGIDLMYGLPGQSLDAWKRVLETAVAYGPEHLSLYALTIEKGTPLADRCVVADDDAQADMYEWAREFLEGRGFAHYEISNWAKPGRESRHNLMYWRGGRYIGIGAAAASFDLRRRWVNERDPARYTRHMLAGSDPVIEEDFVDDPAAERLMLGLRLRAGVCVTDVLRARHGGMFDTFIHQGLMEMAGGHIRLTPRGMMVSNQVLQEFI